MRGKGERCGVSVNEYSCAHGAQINFWRSNSIFNLCFQLRCPRNKHKIFRFKPKQDLFRFDLFHETKHNKIQFVSVYFGVSNLYRNNQNKQNCFETNQNEPGKTKFSEINTKICSLSNCFGLSSVCFGSIETSKLSVSV